MKLLKYFWIGKNHIKKKKRKSSNWWRWRKERKSNDELVKRENELYQTLNKKYGDGEIDSTKGEFIPSPSE